MAKEFIIPDFLKEDADTIHRRMLNKAPSGISTVEGDFFWDNTRPAAEEKAELIQMKLQNVLKLAFPQTSYGVYLEYLGECKSIFKNPATNSTGSIKVIGTPETIIKKGKIVCTIATEERASIEFEFIEDVTIDSTGSVYVKAKCLQAGVIGNVKAGTITVLRTPINGIQSVINEEDFTGGSEIEDEEHFRERVLEAENEENLSGADSDYITWAKEVAGVGSAWVIPEWSGPSTVKVLIVDKNGKVASEELINEVQNYIAPIVPKGENRGGKAPVGAIVTIDTPNILYINISAKFQFEENFSSEDVLKNLKTKIDSYLATLSVGETVIYKIIDSIIGSMILNKEGLKDYSNLTINGGSNNITTVEQIAMVGEVISS